MLGKVTLTELEFILQQCAYSRQNYFRKKTTFPDQIARTKASSLGKEPYKVKLKLVQNWTEHTCSDVSAIDRATQVQAIQTSN